MSEKFAVTNKFELVTMAGARARQLLRGCTPRTAGPEKVARIAAQEIKQGHVRKVVEPKE
jgi:DNA-directed RNA polymerase omega subunit